MSEFKMNAQVKRYVKTVFGQELAQIAKTFGVNPEEYWDDADIQDAVVEALKDTEKYPPNQVLWRGKQVTNEDIIARLDAMAQPVTGPSNEDTERYVEHAVNVLRGEMRENKGDIEGLVAGLEGKMRQMFEANAGGGQPQLPHSPAPQQQPPPKQQPVLKPEDDEPAVPPPPPSTPKVDNNKKGKDEDGKDGGNKQRSAFRTAFDRARGIKHTDGEPGHKKS